ncbi:putative alanine--tRNA ligase [Cucumis melo var. makuwa]|uniref:Alanine--tRNA ligase n=1 Tax=Cucumis melo var. makuwa TaxID=1194695 RepID=A0A5A7V1B8_CUCMM|nr:putative alanine--tRNA ligase [Cucumis melo var. makuwa]
MWKKAQVNKQGQYDNDDVQQVVHKIMNEPEFDVFKGHWALLAINAYEDTVFYLDSLRTTSKETTRYCPLQVGSTKCGYYVMKFMREIVNRGSIVISNFIDTQKPYSHAELDEGGCHYDVGREVEAAVDAELRQGAKVHHTATHLLQSALKRTMYGDDILLGKVS